MRATMITVLTLAMLSPAMLRGQNDDRDKKSSSGAKAKSQPNKDREKSPPSDSRGSDKAKKPDASGKSKTSKKPKQNSSVQRRLAAAKRKSLPEKEAAVKRFVDRHQDDMSELHDLLTYLKNNETRRYDAAVNDLFNSVDRLERTKKQGDKTGYDLGVKRWKFQIQTQMLGARYRMSRSPSILEQIRQVLNEQAEVELQILRRTREKQAVRLRKLDDQISEAEANRRKSIDRRIQSLTNAAKKRGRTVKVKSTKGRSAPKGDAKFKTSKKKPPTDQ